MLAEQSRTSEQTTTGWKMDDSVNLVAHLDAVGALDLNLTFAGTSTERAYYRPEDAYLAVARDISGNDVTAIVCGDGLGDVASQAAEVVDSGEVVSLTLSRLSDCWIVPPRNHA